MHNAQRKFQERGPVHKARYSDHPLWIEPSIPDHAGDSRDHYGVGTHGPSVRIAPVGRWKNSTYGCSSTKAVAS